MDTGRRLYLDLMKKVLTNVVYEDNPLGYEHVPIPWFQGDPAYDPEKRRVGLDWPSVAHTMVGLKRLDNVQECMEQVLSDDVPGDFIETGVWRGGVCIFMRAFLEAYGVKNRRIWVADSFEGIPDVGEDGHPLDVRLGLHRANETLGVPMEVVKANFARYDLLDDQVQFLPGWFRDSLPTAPVERIAILRLDGDLYESTMDALNSLYDKVSPGGFVIVDDYALRSCRRAIDEFRDQHAIKDEVLPIDGASAYWRRSA
ncbi:TylF/MycF family methyltransferase [Micromonospora tulbaghiae]|uniref:O-methyltransferase n=1 Tax=Micromonospora tulbaghiae TaxID=479978 RepID=A0AAW4JCR1_9ACTN|nr:MULTISPECIES: TylF/MycF family methyltransferase [Micromonospora]KAB1910356.1 macrocin O-methyltransferase [Micromonospora sp. AMSO1212t]MBO4139090.1 TylF/MycF family methyltransferase [Micromonospora tulbaghiae]MDX5459249.1 TylF/MycF family methyltransferase [Micromonospora tulbaghiae]SCE73509.1 O-methyltransferase [Micromonospora tulbaghiae]